MSKRYFEDDDKLGRKGYAVFLKNIIDNFEKYKRDKMQESYVVAIDSSWGTGKTFFIDMFENYLLGFDGIRLVNENKDYAVIRFDAWKNDFWNNAFEPFVTKVFENDMFYSDIDATNADCFLKNIVSSSITIAKGIAKKKIEDLIDTDDLEEAIISVNNSFGKFLLHDSALFIEYQQFKDAIIKFKESLSNIVSDKRKIVIIIDELDRCKPTFAIQLLEIVKHLFDIRGIIFIFLIDIEQLSYSIKTVYGQEMDASGYLCRFFDYITRMPKPDIIIYIANSLVDVQLFENCSDADRINFVHFFCNIYHFFVLSLRDIDTIICSYKIMLDSFLYEYSSLDAHCQYLFYLTLKYKDVVEFNNIFLKDKITENMQSISFNGYPCIEESISNLNEVIEDMEGMVISKQYPNGVKDYGGAYYRIVSVQNDEIELKSFTESRTGYMIKLTEDVRLNNILFAPDIKKWKKIKYMKYGQYIHQQLEMFNFHYINVLSIVQQIDSEKSEQ